MGVGPLKKYFFQKQILQLFLYYKNTLENHYCIIIFKKGLDMLHPNNGTLTGHSSSMASGLSSEAGLSICTVPGEGHGQPPSYL